MKDKLVPIVGVAAFLIGGCIAAAEAVEGLEKTLEKIDEFLSKRKNSAPPTK